MSGFYHQDERDRAVNMGLYAVLGFIIGFVVMTILASFV